MILLVVRIVLVLFIILSVNYISLQRALNDAPCCPYCFGFVYHSLGK